MAKVFPLDTLRFPNINYQFEGHLPAWHPRIGMFIDILGPVEDRSAAKLKAWRKSRKLRDKAKSLSEDDMEKILRMKWGGIKLQRIADHFGVSLSFVKRAA